MSGFISNLLDHLGAWRLAWGSRRQAKAEVEQAIEVVAEAAGGYVRAERDYQKALRPVVRNLLGRARREIATIPGPVLVSRATWDSDPVVGAVFKDPDELESVIASNANLKHYFSDHQPDTACAMLTMTRRVKTILWTEVQGQILKRDIPRQAVSFDLHRILAPSTDEAGTRFELIRLYLQYLATQTLEAQLRDETNDKDLKSLLVLADVKLKSLKARRQGPHADFHGTAELNEEIRQAERKKRELEQEMDQARAGQAAQGGHLGVLLAALSHPSQELEVGGFCERLNEFGLRVENGSEETSHEVCLGELSALAHEVKRAAVLIQFRRRDFF